MDEIDTIVLNGAGSSAYMALGNIDKSALGALTVDVNGGIRVFLKYYRSC